MPGIEKKSNNLVIMVKAPIEGKAKTRLNKWLVEGETLELYRCLLLDRFELLLRIPEETVKLFISVYPYREKQAIWELIPPGARKRFKLIPQRGGNLGERIISVFTAFDYSKNRVAIIDTDTPYVTSQILMDAFNKMEDSDVVIGPAKDGGYYFLGLNKFYRSLFEGIPWGRREVLNRTLAAAEKLGLRIKFLETLEDIDTKDDAIRFLNSGKSELSRRAYRFIKEKTS